MGSILSQINGPEDLKQMDVSSLNKLSGEIRELLIETVMNRGGHLASNLGVVELTCALHKVFDAPRDDIVWDVGHQCYVHKIICGRKERFDTLRTYRGISGFPKPSESEYDSFETGHSSTSLSVALGFACAARLKGEERQTVAVIGDASLTGGLSMEALNNISQSKTKVIIVLNDNQMSIGKNMGAFAKYMNRVRTKPSYYNAKRETHNVLDKIPLVGKGITKLVRRAKLYLKYMLTPGVVFEQLGYKYLGPIDGHDISALCTNLEEAKKLTAPVIVHVCTTKGKGYPEAERAPHLFHGVSSGSGTEETFSDRLGKAMCALAEENADVVSVCPSMVESCGLGEFAAKYAHRIFDVGIAEAHAVTFAAGLAQKGLVPVVSVYSSFLQRAYDSIMHDVAIGNRHVVFAVDRAGIVGADGETHQGIYDLSFLSHVPNMSILAPADNEELVRMLRFAVNEARGPVAVRFARGAYPKVSKGDFEFGKASVLHSGSDVTIAALGDMVHTALSVKKLLEKKNVSCEVISLRSALPIDFETLFTSAEKTGLLVTLEDNIISGGVGEAIAAEIAKRGASIPCLIEAFPDKFIPAGSRQELFELFGLDAASLAEKIASAKGKGI